jgi:hypothetical protein
MIYDPSLDVVFGSYNTGSGEPASSKSPASASSSAPLVTTAADEVIGGSAIGIGIGVAVGACVLTAAAVAVVLLKRRRMNAESLRVRNAVRGAAL